jgi:hypothetical protein
VRTTFDVEQKFVDSAVKANRAHNLLEASWSVKELDNSTEWSLKEDGIKLRRS